MVCDALIFCPGVPGVPVVCGMQCCFNIWSRSSSSTSGLCCFNRTNFRCSLCCWLKFVGDYLCLVLALMVFACLVHVVRLLLTGGERPSIKGLILPSRCSCLFLDFPPFLLLRGSSFYFILDFGCTLRDGQLVRICILFISLKREVLNICLILCRPCCKSISAFGLEHK